MKRRNERNNAFTFRMEWVKMLAGCTEEVRLELYDAITKYAQSGTITGLKPMARSIFPFIREQMDEDKAMRDTLSGKRREAVRKRWDKDGKVAVEQQNDTNVSACIQNDTKNTIVYNCIQMNTIVSDEPAGNTSNEEPNDLKPAICDTTGDNTRAGLDACCDTSSPVSEIFSAKEEKERSKEKEESRVIYNNKIKKKEKPNTYVLGEKKENTAAADLEAPARARDSAADALEKRKEKFYNSLVPYVERYGGGMVREFFDYWTEQNRSRTKMRFELERTWETARRLGTWDRNNKMKGYGNKGHAGQAAGKRESAGRVIHLAGEILGNADISDI